MSCNASSYGLCSPDNLAVDAEGNLIIIEDQAIGDIWQAIDNDRDGVADVVGLLARSAVRIGTHRFHHGPERRADLLREHSTPDLGQRCAVEAELCPHPSAALLLLAGLPLLRRRGQG